MDVCPAFIDETGILSGPPQQQPVYGIGVLVIPDTKAITDSLYRLHFNFSADRMAQRQQLRREIQSRVEPATLREIDRLMHSTRHHEYKFTEVTSLQPSAVYRFAQFVLFLPPTRLSRHVAGPFRPGI